MKCLLVSCSLLLMDLGAQASPWLLGLEIRHSMSLAVISGLGTLFSLHRIARSLFIAATEHGETSTV